MTNLDLEMETIVRAAKTPHGTPRISYAQFLALQQIALERSYVVRSGEIHNQQRGQGTFHYTRSEDDPDWAVTVKASIDFAKLVLDERADKESLWYVIWFDCSGSNQE